MRVAVFVRRAGPDGRVGRPKFLGHIYNGIGKWMPGDGPMKQRAADAGREKFSKIIRSCDYVEVYPDNGPEKNYVTSAPSPGGVGLL